MPNMAINLNDTNKIQDIFVNNYAMFLESLLVYFKGWTR